MTENELIKQNGYCVCFKINVQTDYALISQSFSFIFDFWKTTDILAIIFPVFTFHTIDTFEKSIDTCARWYWTLGLSSGEQNIENFYALCSRFAGEHRKIWEGSGRKSLLKKVGETKNIDDSGPLAREQKTETPWTYILSIPWLAWEYLRESW